MKRNLIITILVGLILVTVYSFTSIKPNHKIHKVKAKAKQEFSCNAVVTGVTGVYNGPYSITITWTYTGTPDHFTYGGNFYCATGSSFGTTSTNSTSATITIPSGTGCAYSGINGRIIPICADGTEGTAKVFSVTH
ncbi:hypothetical protein [Mucilaginibacter sp.]|uniref:hypothetical protein n=1 Tax=Mucilaginibacter sp. TaxID=1882438 RepID=UPI003D12664A